jgi:Uma2 family endonuclease
MAMMATGEPAVLAPPEITFEDFLASYDGVHAEWVDGQVHVMSPGNQSQSRLTRFLSGILQLWAEAHDAGEVFVPPFTLRLSGRAGREPDVFFVRTEHADRVKGTYVEGPADLVVEIVSPSSRGTDRGDKYYEYEQAGVSEYWLIDPEREEIEVYRLRANGRYEPVDLGLPEALRSEVLSGLTIPVAWLWQQPLPKLAWVQREWGLI